MKLTYIPVHENNKYSIDVLVKTMGSTTLTEEEEKEILANYNKEIRYRDLQFVGYYDINEAGNVEKIEATTKAKLNIVIPTNNTDVSGEVTIVIGEKTINVSTSEIKDSPEYIAEVNNGVLEALKLDSNILRIYSASDLSLVDGKIVAEKDLDRLSDTLVENINQYFGGEVLTTTKNAITTGVKVTLELRDKKLLIDENFKAHYEIELKEIKSYEVPVGYTADNIAEMKTLCFKDVIYEAVSKIVKEMKKETTDFEDENKDRDSEEF